MFGRGVTSPSTTNDTLNALIEIAKDPTAFQARLVELQAAEESANAAITEAASRRADLNAVTQAANDQAAGLATLAAQLAKDSAALDKARTEFSTMAAGRVSEMDQRNRDLNTRENDLASRSAAVEETERATAALNRQAQADRDAATALLAKLNGIAAELAPLEAQIAALG